MKKHYAVFNVKGNVGYRAPEDWDELTLGTKLNSRDSLFIGYKAELQLVDERTKRIYKGVSMEYTTVWHLVENAKRQGRSSLSAINSRYVESRSTLYRDGKLNTNFLSSYRSGSSDGASVEDSVVSTIAWLCMNDSLIGCENSVGLHKSVADSTVRFSVRNNADREYFVNIVAYNKAAGKARLVLLPGYDDKMPYVVLDKGTEADLKEFELVETDDEVYFLIALDRRFDNEAVNSSLQMGVSEISTGLKLGDVVAVPAVSEAR